MKSHREIWDHEINWLWKSHEIHILLNPMKSDWDDIKVPLYPPVKSNEKSHVCWSMPNNLPIGIRHLSTCFRKRSESQSCRPDQYEHCRSSGQAMAVQRSGWMMLGWWGVRIEDLTVTFYWGGRVSKGFQCRSEHVVCTYTWYICTRANISQADTPKLHVFFCLKSLGRGMPCVTLCPPGTLVASCPTRSS